MLQARGITKERAIVELALLHGFKPVEIIKMMKEGKSEEEAITNFLKGQKLNLTEESPRVKEILTEVLKKTIYEPETRSLEDSRREQTSKIIAGIIIFFIFIGITWGVFVWLTTPKFEVPNPEDLWSISHSGSDWTIKYLGEKEIHSVKIEVWATKEEEGHKENIFLGAVTRNTVKPGDEINLIVQAKYVDYEVIITCQELPQCLYDVHCPELALPYPANTILQLETSNTTIKVGQTIAITAKLYVVYPIPADELERELLEIYYRFLVQNQTIKVYTKLVYEQDWSLYKVGKTGEGGIYSFTFSSNTPGTYQIKAVFEGSFDLAPCESSILEINVK